MSGAKREKEMPLPKDVRAIMDVFEAAGFEAFVVGGCVRSHLLGREIHDYDLATNARTEDILSLFAGEKIITAGIKHLTVGIYTGRRVCEITTYRSEGIYSDSRHPDFVLAADTLYEDAKRRDFTMNAIYYSPSRGFVDPCGGIDDIRCEVIRAVGEPSERFSEDALRILRALRFAANLNFTIEARTKEGVHSCRESLSSVSAERIFEEFSRLVVGYGAANVLREYVDVIAVFIPELSCIRVLEQHNPHHIYTVWEHTLIALSHTPPVLSMRLAVLLHDIGKGVTLSIDEAGVGHFYKHAFFGAQMAEAILRRLRSSEELTDSVCMIIRSHDAYLHADKPSVRRLLNRFGEDGLRRLLIQKRVDGLAKAPGSERTPLYDEIERLLNEIINKKDCTTLKELAINGSDLVRLGVPQGKRIGEILSTLLDEVLDGILPNSAAALSARAKELAVISEETCI